MTNRQRLATTLLWIAVVFVGTMFGASVYQRISLIPEWSSDLPHSVTRYFLDTNAGVAMDRFWTVVTAPTAVTILFAFIFNWRVAGRRRWISLGAILFFLMLVWTAMFFIPKGVIPLMQRGGAGLTPEAITQMARAWIFWDWFRMAGTLGSYLCLLKAATHHHDVASV